MKTVTVSASKKYDICVGSGLLQNAGALICKVHSPAKALIVTDSNVGPLYSDILLCSLNACSIEATLYCIPAGESSKNMENFSNIVNRLAELKFSRSDMLIALGGGVVGDITGFAASCYMRGIAYVQIPTSLLAMVDSSVGGKTAIDLPAGKNLLGAFYQPKLVLCDTNTLDTLPEKVFADGCAEVIKYAVLFDSSLFKTLQSCGRNFPREDVIYRCVELKRDVVEEDEFDTGTRQLLNFGHTVGHAIEKLSDMTITHGSAVAAGMAIIAKAACSAGICDMQCVDIIKQILDQFCLPAATVYDANALCEAILMDKKRSANTINLIVPEDIGKCRIHPLSVDSLYPFTKEGL